MSINLFMPVRVLLVIVSIITFTNASAETLDEEVHSEDDAFKYGTYNSQMQSPEGASFSGVNNLPALHKKYIPRGVEQEVKILDYDQYNPKHQNATKDELTMLRKYYRHVNLKNKIPQMSYISFRYLYALPTIVQDYQNKISGSTVVQNAAIEVFNTISASNNGKLLLDKRSFGISASYGKKLSARTHSEWEILFYQKSFIHSDSTANGIPISYDYIDSTGATQTTTLQYNNVEYIQRNFAVLYSRHFEFLSFFGESSSDKIRRFIPYVTIGGGAISRWNYLRFSAGTLGTSSVAQDLTTKESMFNFMPAFIFGGGIRYRVTETIYFDGQIKSIQPTNDINFQNYIASIGLRIYF